MEEHDGMSGHLIIFSGFAAAHDNEDHVDDRLSCVEHSLAMVQFMYLCVTRTIIITVPGLLKIPRDNHVKFHMINQFFNDYINNRGEINPRK